MKGRSGNPKGRPRDSSEAAPLRALIAEHLPDIFKRLIGAALARDMQAARLLLDHVLAPPKAGDGVSQISAAQLWDRRTRKRWISLMHPYFVVVESYGSESLMKLP